MKPKKKTLLNLLLILFVVSFFVTPMGHYSKIWLNRLFATAPEIIERSERQQITDYDWKLKDEDWSFFNFEKSKGRVVFINLWASWRLPSEAELAGVQKLYDAYHNKVDFYIITNEERPPVEEFMQKHGFTFPVTYLIIDEKAPIAVDEVPSSYLIDKNGYVVVHENGIANWNSGKVHDLLEELLAE